MRLRSTVFWGTGALTASLSPVASFLTFWDPTVKGNEWPAEASSSLKGAARMAESGGGEPGMVPSPRGITSFRSVSPPCPTNPGLLMQQQSLEKDKSTGTLP